MLFKPVALATALLAFTAIAAPNENIDTEKRADMAKKPPRLQCTGEGTIVNECRQWCGCSSTGIFCTGGAATAARCTAHCRCVAALV
ncbi:uncharacterized protein K452DRAFT_293043 [Aplosporella prunicola CBS 121167]|uniref:Invertebrate defensins family profile domain-containing protein n=1 Tax=Aplosporella prunicola CBS 121167 TaxID=1176127 RepID=A0A6A6AXG1_9PEZI|nr:uncharacterized protein K452DRAFT_293043 [Aplosporella prunicola CBS 121167]KAF2135665.1 hypothetical protein K452DRAFT_293043 [Aplosporella prunicola CBS 121167]